MKAWAAPVIDGIRQDHAEIELETDGLTVLPHTLPWERVAYRYEFEPGENPGTRPFMTSSSTTEIELKPTRPRGLRGWLDWLLFGSGR